MMRENVSNEAFINKKKKTGKKESRNYTENLNLIRINFQKNG